MDERPHKKSDRQTPGSVYSPRLFSMEAPPGLVLEVVRGGGLFDSEGGEYLAAGSLALAARGCLLRGRKSFFVIDTPDTLPFRPSPPSSGSTDCCPFLLAVSVP